MANANTRKEYANKIQELLIQYEKACVNQDELRAAVIYDSIASSALELFRLLTYSIDRQEMKSKGIDTDEAFYTIATDSLITFLSKVKKHQYDPTQSEYKEYALLNYFKLIIKGHYQNYDRKYSRISQNTIQVESWVSDGGEESERSQIERFEDKNYNLDEQLFVEDLQQELFGHLFALAKNDTDRELINYVFVQSILENKLTNTEIAELMGCSVANITQRTKKFMEKIREKQEIIDLLTIIKDIKNK